MTRIVAFDIEAESLDAKRDASKRIWCVGFAGQINEAASANVATVCLPWDEGKKVLQQFADDPDVVLWCHNAAFDVATARTHGVNIQPGRYVCTQLLKYVLKPGKEVGLDYCAKELLGEEKRDIKQELIDRGFLAPRAKKSETFALDFAAPGNEAAMELLQNYCAHDAELCFRIGLMLMNRLNSDKRLHKNFHDVELPYVEVIIEMEKYGMVIDLAKLGELEQTLCTEIQKTSEQLAQCVSVVPEAKWDNADATFVPVVNEYKSGKYKNSKVVPEKFYAVAPGVYASSNPTVVYNHCNYEPFNLDSGDQIALHLMLNGWEPTSFSPATGKPVVDKDTLEKLSAEYPSVPLILASRQLDNLKSSFVDKLRVAAEQNAGIAYPSFNQCVTLTTRLSSSGAFNAQSMPVRTELGAKIRDCIIAPPGFTVLCADLDRIEIVVLAAYLEHVCGESRMADAIRRKEDVHQANADAWAMSRTHAKTFVFLIVYGGQAELAAQRLNISLKAAQNAIDTLHENMPAIQELMELVWSGAEQNNATVYTVFGSRLQYLDLLNGNKWEKLRAQRQIFNALIQGTAANINKILMARVKPLLNSVGGYLFGAVHDEALACVPEHTAEFIIPLLNEAYYDEELLNGIPVSGEWNKGTSWKEAKGS